MKSGILALVALAFASTASAIPPPAPIFTVAATDIKQLQFDITPVPRVSWYELWFRPNAAAAWVKYTETAAQHPRIRINVSVHLLDWREARYVIRACNPGGCGSSSERGVDGEQLAALGFFKPNSPTGVTEYGGNVAASADGRTIAVASGETLGSNVNSVVVHVYRKTTATSGWRRQVRLLPSVQQAHTFEPFNSDILGISADGNLIALGVWLERAGGAVYLFRYDGTAWLQVQRIVGTGELGDYFGNMVKLDDTGTRLVVEHSDADIYLGGLLEVYHASSTGVFTHAARLTTPSSGSGGASTCLGFAFSGDGRTLARPCFGVDDRVHFVQTLRAATWTEGARIPIKADYLDLSYDGTQLLTQTLAASPDLVAAYKLGPQGWVREGSLASHSGFGGYDEEGDQRYMRRIAISRDGKIAAIGSPKDRATGLGPLYPPYTDSGAAHGGVVVHQRKANGTWSLRRVLAPGSTNNGRAGSAVALGDNGRLLVVGAFTDPSAATGIDGDRDDASMPFRGAAWIY
jgi:hypothetical protein